MKKLTKMKPLETYELKSNRNTKCLVWKSECRHYYVKFENCNIIRVRGRDLLASLAFLEYDLGGIL